MSLKNLSDDQVVELIQDPEGFLKKKENMEAVMGFDSESHRKFADIMRYKMKLSDQEIKKKLEIVEMIRLKEIDIWN